MVLVITVLVLSILMVLGYTFSYSAGVNLSAARNARSDMVQRFATESALNYALGMLRADARIDKTDTLDDAWAAERIVVEVDGEEYAIGIVDENRKLNINAAVAAPEDPDKSYDLAPVLRRLVREAGGSEQDSDILVAGVDPARPLPLIAALRGLPGIDLQLFEEDRDQPALDALLATHPKRINVNTASEALIDALWDNPGLTRSVLNRREATAFRDESDILRFLNGHLPPEDAERAATVLDAKSDYFTINVAPVVDGAAWELAALVHRGDGDVSVLSVQRVLKEAIP